MALLVQGALSTEQIAACAMIGSNKEPLFPIPFPFPLSPFPYDWPYPFPLSHPQEGLGEGKRFGFFSHIFRGGKGEKTQSVSSFEPNVLNCENFSIGKKILENDKDGIASPRLGKGREGKGIG